jgi:signal transduction histidine kinase
MNPLAHFFDQHMIVVFFLYGLAFFVLGMSVALRARWDSQIQFGRYLWMLAGFGLLHALNEWLDMFLILGEAHWTAYEVRVLVVLRLFVGCLSFVSLLQFGACSLAIDRPGRRLLPPLAVAASALVVAALLASGIASGFSARWLLTSDLATRYLLALPAILLAALAFRFQRTLPSLRDFMHPGVVRSLAWLTLSFVLYAFFAGLVVREAPFFPASVFNQRLFLETTGIPVQFFRAACAVAIAFHLGRVLKVFDIEAKGKLENAYSEIIRASHMERMRIGQDLHDSLCQQLTGIAFMCRAVESKLQASPLPGAAADIRPITTLVNQSVEVARSLTRGLAPLGIQENGLAASLDELGESIAAGFGVACRVEAPDPVQIAELETATHLYRIAQEAISNALKHGRAREIVVHLGEDDESIRLSITDDGIGLPEGYRDSRGIGLRIMGYRARVIGAELDVGRGPAGGTVVLCRLDKERARRGAENREAAR